MKIEIPVGTKLLINGTKCAAVVDEDYHCSLCVLKDAHFCASIACWKSQRHDEKSIHFEKVI